MMKKSAFLASSTLVSLLVAGFGASSTAAFAQDSRGSGSATVETVTVTAEKKSEKLLDVPVPVTVLDADKMASNGQVLLRDYANTVPGLFIAPDIEDNQMVSIRGITTGSFSNPTVGIVVDDIPFGATTSWDGGNEVPDIDPGDLARIEVLRGPQGTLYGAGSMGGLIKFVTRDPSVDAFSGRIEGGYSSVKNGAEPGFDLRGSFNIPLTDALAIRVSGFERQDPGYIDNILTNTRGINKVDADGARLSVLWTPTENLSVKINALYQHKRAGGLSEVNVGPGLGDLQQNFIKGVADLSSENQVYSATINYSFHGIELTSITGYNTNHSYSPFDYSPFIGGSDPTSLTEMQSGVAGAGFYTNIDVEKFTQELRLSGQLGSSFDWLIGGFFTHEDNGPENGKFQILYNEDPISGKVVGPAQENRLTPESYREVAVFGDVTYHVTDKLDVQIGARESFIRISDSGLVTGNDTLAFFGQPSPFITPAAISNATSFTYLLTPSYKVTDNIMVYGRLASGYRPGGPNTNGGVGVPPTYAPDKTKNYEVGAKADFFDHKLTLDASLFYIDWTDLQLTLFTPLDVSYVANGSRAKSEGFELSAQARPLPGLSVGGWIDVDDAVLTDPFPANSNAYGRPGNRLPNSSRFSGHFSVEQDFPIADDFSGYVGGQVSYVGDRVGVFQGTNPNGTPVARQVFPSYTKADLNLGVRNESWSLNGYVTNVSDARGVVNGGSGFIEPNTFVYITPRTFGVSISKTF